MSNQAEPVTVGTLNGYTLIAYEGWYYGLPEAYGDINLAEQDVMELSGVIRDLSREVVESEIAERAAFQTAAE